LIDLSSDPSTSHLLQAPGASLPGAPPPITDVAVSDPDDGDADDPVSTSDAAVAPVAAVVADTLADNTTIMLLNMMIHPPLKSLIKKLLSGMRKNILLFPTYTGGKIYFCFQWKLHCTNPIRQFDFINIFLIEKVRAL
jgi:hypothetical protein